jgi:hypothetical protein
MMNNLIKELEEQCWSNGYGMGKTFEPEKFAQLIIAECIGLIVKENEGEASGDWGAGYTAGLDTAKLSIEENFGVE